MYLLLTLVLSLLSVAAFAQTCGPDTAPPVASAQGYTCETFRWGSGDIASEIDSAKTYAAPCATPGISPCGGFKWYWANTNNGVGQNHNTVSGDYSVQAVTGKIISQTSVPADHGKFVINTCGGPSTNWTTGTFFKNGYFAEFVGEWNATGNPGVQTGFYGLDIVWYASGFPGTCPSGQCWEIDDPDAFALNQAVVSWAGGSGGTQSNSPPNTFFAPTIETGSDKWGVLSTNSATTWWVDNGSGYVSNGAVQFGGGSAAGVNASQMCFGIDSTSQFSLTLDSFKVWQAPPPVPPSRGGGRLLRH
jgi:hypothetical protein